MVSGTPIFPTSWSAVAIRTSSVEKSSNPTRSRGGPRSGSSARCAFPSPRRGTTTHARVARSCRRRCRSVGDDRPSRIAIVLLSTRLRLEVDFDGAVRVVALGQEVAALSAPARLIRTSFVVNGFTRYPSAPISNASWAVSGSSNPVTRMTATRGKSAETLLKKVDSRFDGHVDVTEHRSDFMVDIEPCACASAPLVASMHGETFPLRVRVIHSWSSVSSSTISNAGRSGPSMG